MVASATPRPAERPESPAVIAVAFSGGLDSTALLHVTTRMASGLRVVALHVHHGLQAEADDWLEHCRAVAAEFGADFACRRLVGAPAAGDSIEAWARAGRHAALREMAREAGADLLLLAHHRRDQAETFLLQAMRGAGLAGLAAMPQQQWRDGLCWARPWLHQPREALEAYTAQHGLRWIEDPSNAQTRFLRNRLRQQLATQFPGAEIGLAQSARWAQQAQDLAREVAEADLAGLVQGERLDLAGLASLSPARASNALRAWLVTVLAQPAPAALVERLLSEWRPGAQQSWPAAHRDAPGQLHAYRDGLYWTKDVAETPADTVLDLSQPGCYPQPGWGGGWRVEPAQAGAPGLAPNDLEQVLQRGRQGGERFQRAPASTARSLKKSAQEAGLPPWRRQGPLLWAGARLLAVAGLGMDARAFAPNGEQRLSIRWVEDSVLPQREGEGGGPA